MGQQKMAAVRRLNGELRKHGKSMPPVFTAGPHGDNMMQWDAFIPGAPGTGGRAASSSLDSTTRTTIRSSLQWCSSRRLCIILTSQRRVWCAYLLKDKWAPSVQIRQILEALQNLMANPEPGHALEPLIAEESST